MPKVLGRFEEAIKEGVHFTGLDWLVFPRDVRVKMFVERSPMSPPPLTVRDETHVVVPFHSDYILSTEKKYRCKHEIPTGQEPLSSSSDLNNSRTASQRGHWFSSDCSELGMVVLAL